ncbi:OmpA family protein [Burkholderia ubonensis]|nr:OmpA family protein [Burkholderia ubonensis]
MSLTRHIRFWLVWCAIPGIVFVSMCLPTEMQPGWLQVAAAVLAAGAAVVALDLVERRRDAHAGTLESVDTSARELPVIVVVGPYAGALFPGDGKRIALRRERDALWLRADTPAELDDAMTQVKTSRGSFPDLAILPVVAEGDDDGTLRHEFSTWRNTLRESFCHPEYVLPCSVVVYARLGGTAAGQACSISSGDLPGGGARRPANGVKLRDLMTAMRRRLTGAPQSGSPSRDALTLAVLDWFDAATLEPSVSSLANTSPLALRDLVLMDAGQQPARPGAWTSWLIVKTGLRPDPANLSMSPLSLPLPRAALQTDAPARPGERAFAPRQRGDALDLVYSVAATMTVAVIVSAWMNHRLIERVADDLVQYWSTPNEAISRKRITHAQIEQDRVQASALLENMPVAYGWGLYRGHALLAALDTALAAYQPPVTTVQIDSLSLFMPGRVTLDPGAAQRELRRALRLIVANPDQRVLIAGHTDSEGSPDANFRLSEARARAIRDWFVTVGRLPATRFAIQGFGHTRPIADNGSAAGRARNRRVDISLFPAAPRPVERPRDLL